MLKFLLAVLALGTLLILPFLLIFLVGRFLLWAILIPFKVAGAVLGVFLGVLGFAAKIVLAVLGLVLGILVLVGTALVLPLLPLVLVGLFVWLLVRLLQPRPHARPVS